MPCRSASGRTSRGSMCHVGVPHGIELDGEQLFLSNVHGGPRRCAATYLS